jgi:hypothetical protein
MAIDRTKLYDEIVNIQRSLGETAVRLDSLPESAIQRRLSDAETEINSLIVYMRTHCTKG